MIDTSFLQQTSSDTVSQHLHNFLINHINNLQSMIIRNNMQKLNKQGATFLVHFQILPNICRYSNLKLTLLQGFRAGARADSAGPFWPNWSQSCEIAIAPEPAPGQA